VLVGNHLFVIFAVLDVSCAVNSCINYSFFYIFGITFRPLVIHFVIVSRHQQTPLLTTSHTCHNLWDRAWSCGVVLITAGRSQRWHHAVKTKLAQNRNCRLPHLHSTPPLGKFPLEYCHVVWCGKTRMVGLPEVKKIRRYVNLFWQNPGTWQTDTQIDRRTETAWRLRPRMHSITRQRLRVSTLKTLINKCTGDDTKDDARQSLNSIKNKKKIKYGEKRFSIWRMEFLHPAMWHMALESWQWIHKVAAPCNAIRGSGMTCHSIEFAQTSTILEFYIWFPFPHITAVDMSFCNSMRNFIQIGPPSAEKKWRLVDFQDGGSQPSWIVGIQ